MKGKNRDDAGQAHLDARSVSVSVTLSLNDANIPSTLLEI